MQKYELVFILRVDQPESEMQARVDRCAAIIAKHDGEITKQEHWGVRRLAYEIDHQDKGNYMFLKFRSKGTVVEELNTALRLDDMVLRHLTVKDEEWSERNRAAIAKRRRKFTDRETTSAKE